MLPVARGTEDGGHLSVSEVEDEKSRSSQRENNGRSKSEDLVVI
jgi:hypothetical protein